MEWNKGFSARYYSTFVDPVTWRDTERFEVTGGSIKRTESGLMQSAGINVTKYDQNIERFIRVYLDARQTGDSSHNAIFTGLATAPEKEINGNMSSYELDCYSVLKPAQDVFLPLGYYAPAGVPGAEIVRDLLSQGTPAPVKVEGESPLLSQYIIAEDGENLLSMSQKVLTAIGWRLRINGMGEVTICDLASKISASFDPLGNDCIEPQIKAVNDWYSCPNVFRAVMDDVSAVARDDSTESPLSTVSRGREVWMEEKDCNLNDNESLADYAYRRLKEEQMHYLAVDYSRRFDPNVTVSDVVRLHYPNQGLDGLFYVTSQSIELGYGARTSEEVVQL